MRMKNKKAEQIASRQKHRDQLKAQRRGQLILERAEATLHVIPTILIVCEGINTEPRAERNFGQFDHANPAKEESSTTVFRLVQELLKYV